MLPQNRLPYNYKHIDNYEANISVENLPESLSQGILAGGVLVGRLGASEEVRGVHVY